ncbi:MAG: hypothetical protein HY811_02725 [Planctomycetes bacterium]|nr:hypothetical protein [Planctomycetota bacterium]
MAECAEFTKYGLLYYSGELSGDELASYEKHLTMCAVCRKEMEEAGAIIDRIKSAGVMSPSPERAREIRRMINRSDFSIKRVFWASLSTAAALLIALLLSVPKPDDYEKNGQLMQSASEEGLKWKNGIDSEISLLKYKIASFEKATLSAESTEWDEFLDEMEDNINELNEQIEEM